jgi:hypothetical protein
MEWLVSLQERPPPAPAAHATPATATPCLACAAASQVIEIDFSPSKGPAQGARLLTRAQWDAILLDAGMSILSGATCACVLHARRACAPRLCPARAPVCAYAAAACAFVCLCARLPACASVFQGVGGGWERGRGKEGRS